MLPYLIEHIGSLRGLTGRPLAQFAQAQTYVPVWPSRLTVYLEISPPDDVYAWIYWRWRLSKDVSSDAFDIEVSVAGERLSDAIMDEVIQRDAFVYVIVSHSEKIVFRVENISTINQYWASTDKFLIVYTSEDMKLIYENLERLKAVPQKVVY